MDSIDRQILKELQLNARITNNDLAQRVNLSPTPCLRRVRNMEKSGLIKGYTTVVDYEMYGLPVMAFVTVRLEKQTDTEIKKFESGVVKLPEVAACYLMSGTQDYLLHVLSASLKDYEVFVRAKLTKIAGIKELETHFAFGTVKTSTLLPEHN